MTWNPERIPESEIEADPFGDFDLDTEGVDAEKVGSRLQCDLPGKYHFEIAVAKVDLATVNGEGKLTAPHINCTLVVLHSVPRQSPEGAVLYHRVFLAGSGGGKMEEWQQKSTVEFLTGIGLLKKVDGKIIDPETNSTKPNIRTMEERLTGWQFVGDLKIEKSRDPQYADRVAFSFGRGAFPIDDKAVVSIPRNKDALKLIKPVQGVDIAKLLVAVTEAERVASGAAGTPPAQEKAPKKPPAKPPTTKTVEQSAAPGGHGGADLAGARGGAAPNTANYDDL